MRNRIGHKDNFKNESNKPADTEASGREALTEYISKLSGVTTGDKPSLIFLSSTGKVDRKHPMFRQLDGVDKASKAVQQVVFHTRPAFISNASDRAVRRPRPNTVHDFRVAIGSNYFNCVNVNLFDVAVSDSNKINQFTAPIVIVTNAKGEVQDILTGRQIRSASVFKAMATVMQDSGYENFAMQVAEANKILNLLYRAEIELANVTARRATPANQNKASQYREAIKVGESKYEEAINAINPSSGSMETASAY